MKKKTLCWQCKNFINCDWFQLDKPVEGWDATPTTFVDLDNIVHSYCVNTCPLFVPYKIGRQITLNGISKIIRKPERTICRWLKKGDKVAQLLRAKGYLFTSEQSGEKHKYYIKKI